MRIILSAMVAVCLVPCLAVTTNGKTTREPALADIIPFGCSEELIGLFADSLKVSWNWENGTTQSKFGGDVTYKVSGSVAGIYGMAVNFEEVIVTTLCVNKSETPTPLLKPSFFKHVFGQL